MKQVMTVWGFKDGEEFRKDFDVSHIPPDIFLQMCNKILYQNAPSSESKDFHVKIWMYGREEGYIVP